MNLLRTLAGILAIICAVLIVIDFLVPKALGVDLESGKLFLVGLIAVIFYAASAHLND